MVLGIFQLIEILLFWQLCFCMFYFLDLKWRDYLQTMRTKQAQKSDEIHFSVSIVCVCVCVWSALACREVCQTVGLFSSVSLCPLGPITGERLTSYLYLAENGVCVCVCGGQVGFSEPVEWSQCWQQAGNWKRGKKNIKDSAAVRHFCSDESLAEKIQNKWNWAKTKASVTDWWKKIVIISVLTVRASGRFIQWTC